MSLPIAEQPVSGSLCGTGLRLGRESYPNVEGAGIPGRAILVPADPFIHPYRGQAVRLLQGGLL
jgi:hypothetical protein